jgi:hypothetical protein
LFSGETTAHPASIPPEVPGSSRWTAQIALAWLLAQGDDIAPIPAPNASPASRRTRQPTLSSLSVEQIARLNDLTPATGERHNEANMATIER